MCKAMERLNKMAIEEDHEDVTIQLLKDNVAIDVIARATGFSEARIRKIQEGLLVEA